MNRREQKVVKRVKLHQQVQPIRRAAEISHQGHIPIIVLHRQSNERSLSAAVWQVQVLSQRLYSAVALQVLPLNLHQERRLMRSKEEGGDAA